MPYEPVHGGARDFSEIGKGRVYLWTVLGAVGCVIVTLAIDSLNFHNLTAAQLTRALAIDILLPASLAIPTLFVLLSKMRDLALAKQELAKLASTDSLTGVLNRGAFTSRAADSIAAAERAELPRGALLIIDIDRFKCINDRYGHASGDDALRQIAAALQSVLRPTDHLGRIGGEEFAIYLPDTSALAAETIAERIRHAIASINFAVDGAPISLSASVGGAAFERNSTFDDLFAKADAQLYRAKDGGRDRVEFLAPAAPDETAAA